MADIGVEILAEDSTSKGVAAAKKSLSGLGTAGKAAMNVLKVGALAGATAIAGVGAAALNVSKDTQAASKAMKASLGVTEAEAERLAGVAQDVFGNNFAGSVTEAADAVIALEKHVGDLNTVTEQTATEMAFNISDAFGPSVDEVIAAVGVLQNEFEGLSTEEAFDLITEGFQRGLNKSDDFLDSIGEYSNLFAEGGATAGEFFQTMEDGMEGGVLGTDKIADAFKEFQIKLLEGDKEFGKSLARIGVDQAELFSGLKDGSISTQDAMKQIVAELNKIDDPMRRAQEEAALFGTMAEDLGAGFTKNLTLVEGAFADVAGSTNDLNDQYDTIGDNLSGVWRQVLVALTPFTDELVKMANDYLPVLGAWIADNMPRIIEWFQNAYEQAQPFISGFATGAVTIFDWLQDLWAWLSSNEALMIAVFVAIGAAIVTAMGPVSLAVAAITGIITAVGLIKENWDTIKQYFTDLWDNVGGTFSEKWGLIKDFVLTPFMEAVGKVTEAWSGVGQWFVDLWNNIGLAFAIAWQGITDILFPSPSYGQQIASVWESIVTNIADIFKRGANFAIKFLNLLVEAMNKPLEAWNALGFSIKGFGPVEVPAPTFKNPRNKINIGWGGINLETPDVPLVPRIPQLATGGIVTQPTVALIGEAGPEAVIPLSVGAGGGFGRNVMVNVYVAGSVVSEHELDNRIRYSVNEGLRHEGIG